MVASILQEDLNKGMMAVSRVVAARGQLPVLAHVLLEADERGLTLSATNLELGMRIFVGGKTEESGAITVPAKNFSEFVASLSSGQVKLELQGEKLKAGNGKMAGTFTGIAASEFPTFAKATDGTKKLNIRKEVLREIDRQVAFCAAVDESRPVLTGVQFKPIEDQLTVTATDGFRMSRKQLPMETFGLNEAVILPSRTIAEITKIASEGKKESVEFAILSESNQAIFIYDNTQLVSRILEGNFPDVGKIIPVEYKARFVGDREELLRAVRAVSIFARENNNIVKFKIRDNKLTIYAVATSAGESDAEVEAEIESREDLETAFNYRYLMDFLSSVSEERVVFESNGSLAPGVWKLEKDTGVTHLVMPVRV